MANYRDRRVGQEIMREVNDILNKRIRDPRVQGITITDVRVTGDLQQATIYYSLLSDLASEQQKAQQGLDKAKGLIRKELGQRLTLYKTPELIFERIVVFYKNGDRYLKEMGSGKSSLYFFLFFFVLHSMREHIIQFIGFWPSFIFVLILVPNLMLGVGHINHWYKKRS